MLSMRTGVRPVDRKILSKTTPESRHLDVHRLGYAANMVASVPMRVRVPLKGLNLDDGAWREGRIVAERFVRHAGNVPAVV